MAASDSMAKGVTLGLLTVLGVMVVGAMCSQKLDGPDPAPSPSPDRSVIIVPQRSPK